MTRTVAKRQFPWIANKRCERRQAVESVAIAAIVLIAAVIASVDLTIKASSIILALFILRNCD